VKSSLKKRVKSKYNFTRTKARTRSYRKRWEHV